MQMLLFARAFVDALSFHIARTPRAHALALCASTLAALFAWMFLIPVGSFPEHSIVTIEEGTSFAELADSLERDGFIRSSFMLRALARLTFADDSVQAGRYLFEKPVGSGLLLMRLVTGAHGISTVRVTFPEGTAAYEMAEILQEKITGFDALSWEMTAEPFEGYLFPDTYDFLTDASIEEIVARMRDNFDERTKGLRKEAQEKGIDFNDIVTMASIIEEEANTAQDRHIVSGILWSRIKEEVALQVDATFGYIHGIPGYVPTGDDPEVESPYNTYLNRGLPPGPITNPGLEALDAALHPAETDYFYYLTGKDGKMYYAKSFEEHKRNRENYLD